MAKSNENRECSCLSLLAVGHVGPVGLRHYCNNNKTNDWNKEFICVCFLAALDSADAHIFAIVYEQKKREDVPPSKFRSTNRMRCANMGMRGI